MDSRWYGFSTSIGYLLYRNEKGKAHMKISPYLQCLVVTMVLQFGLPVPASGKSSDCLSKKNTICRNILKLSPTMDHEQAYRLSNQIYWTAKRYGLPSDLLLAIAFQESGFKTDIVRELNGLVYDEKTKGYREVRIGADFCMMQIHLSNIKKMNLDVKKLLSNTKYCLDAGAKILSQYRAEHGKKDENWWTYYNAIHEAKRQIYFRQVNRHLEKIKNQKVEVATNN